MDADHEKELQLQIQYALVEKLASSQQQQARLLQLLEECIFECDFDFNISFATAAWHTQLGYKPEEVVSQSLHRFLKNPEDLSCYQTQSTQAPIRLELQIKRQDGQLVWFELRLVNRPKEGFAGILFNINQRKSAELELENSYLETKKLSLVASYSQGPVIITDATGKAEWVNFSFMSTYGYALDNILGKKPVDIINGPDTNAATLQKINLAIAKRETFHVDMLSYTHSGNQVWIHLDGYPVFNDADELVNYINIIQDISVQKQLESLLKEASINLQITEQTKVRLLANVSHEMRTPLNAIIGGLELIPEDSLSADSSDTLKMIKEAANSLKSIVSNLFTSSREGRASEHDVLSPDNIRRLLSSLIRMLEVQNINPSIEIKLVITENLPEWILIDTQRLQQILTNLLTNALKFTNTGQVQLTAKLDSLKTHLVLIITDTGVGISDEEIQTIFEPFKQIDSSIARGYEGLGLGLSICKQLIDELGGTIDVKSVPGQGTTFTVRLPYHAHEHKNENRSLTRATPKINLSGKKVLIVDDNRTNQMLLDKILVNVGCQTLSASNGVEACEQCENQDFDLILMDLQMPVMDGITAIRRIRASQSQNARTPMIAVTADALQQVKQETLEAGACAVLYKPIESSAMLELIDSTLSTHIEKSKHQ